MPRKYIPEKGPATKKVDAPKKTETTVRRRKRKRRSNTEDPRTNVDDANIIEGARPRTIPLSQMTAGSTAITLKEALEGFVGCNFDRKLMKLRYPEKQQFFEYMFRTYGLLVRKCERCPALGWELVATRDIEGGTDLPQGLGKSLTAYFGLAFRKGKGNEKAESSCYVAKLGEAFPGLGELCIDADEYCIYRYMNDCTHGEYAEMLGNIKPNTEMYVLMGAGVGDVRVRVPKDIYGTKAEPVVLHLEYKKTFWEEKEKKRRR